MIFAFTSALYPRGAYLAAAGLLFLWLLDLLIFREPEFVKLPLYYPTLAFILFLGIAWVVARINGQDHKFAYLGFLALFYFVVPGFVVTSEQRKMILWTFISSILLYSGLRLVTWWSGIPEVGSPPVILTQPHITFLALAICVLAAHMTEAENVFEFGFYILACIPLVLLALLSLDKTILIILPAIALSIAIFRDRRVFIPLAIFALLMILGVGEINYYIEKTIGWREYADFALVPINVVLYDPDMITHASFFGAAISNTGLGLDSIIESRFLLDLIKYSGAPAGLLLLYIFFERARESFFKRRKVALPEERTYHLTVLLVLIATVILNLYSTSFYFPNVVLTTWLILGTSEV
jgi:hypothetical protein